MMASATWISQVPLASRTLLTMHSVTQQALDAAVEEMAPEFDWLEEIVEEAYRLFSVKSTKLQQMPKTPSMKQKGQKRGRQKIEKVQEEEVKEEGSPFYSKGVPTRLTFESPKASNTNEQSRPVRNCRKTSKPIYNDEVELPKKTTRQSRKPLPQRLKAEDGLLNEVQISGQEKKTVNTNAEAGIISHADDSKGASKVNSVEQSGKKSPSVKDRTKAYESMLKQKLGMSPVIKIPRVATPGSGSKAAWIGSSPMMDTTAKDLGTKRTSLETMSKKSLHHDTQLRRSRRSSDRKSAQKKLSAASVKKQTRTRLRLKKQQQEQDMDTSEVEQPALRESKHLLPLHPTSKHLSPNRTLNASPQSGIQHNHQNQRDILNETETVITEVFELGNANQPARLREYEIVQTKTTPICEIGMPRVVGAFTDSRSDQGFNESVTNSSDGYDPKDKNRVKDIIPSSDVEMGPPMPSRTRTRAQKKNEDLIDCGTKPNKDSGVVSEGTSKADSTFVKNKVSPEPDVRVTRTKTRAHKDSQKSDDKEQTARTRQKKIVEGSGNQEVARAIPNTNLATEETFTITRSRLRNPPAAAKLLLCGSDDEVVASSPVVGTPRPSLRGASKRLAEERGLSPRPKRSCLNDQSCLNIRSPQLASSPIRAKGAGLDSEENDTVSSVEMGTRPFRFLSAQKKTSGFLNRTPGFKQNTSKLYSFLSNTPTCRSSSFVTSFLKKNTPPPKQNSQLLLEQKRLKLLEKEDREKERLKRAAEFRKRKIEEQRRQREEKEHKVAEAREMRLRNEQEQKNRINKKIEDKATVKEKLLEERCKEEKEKQKQRLKKQMEADARRKQEEEERLKKLLEQEEEAKMHAEFMQRKKDYEEAERRRQIAEEKRKQEERLVELEQKRQEEIVRQKQAEEEKERERERIRQEKEKFIAQERADREKMEREKREEKERKIKEEMEKLNAMEKERLRCQQEKLQKQKLEEAEQNAIRQMINKHNTSLAKQPSTSNLMNTTHNAGNTSNSKIHSYDLTPVKLKIIAKNKNPDNYDLDDKNSDDSTDDDEAPKKKIPEWATGIQLNTALVRQHANPPDLEMIFHTSCIEPINLELVFPGQKRKRFNQRTSSAIWSSPPYSRH